jgi:hypothetical protein
MGFAQPNIAAAEREIIRCVQEIRSGYNDGWTQQNCKHQLYQLKCLLDDVYPTLPAFADEHKWEQQRIVDVLKHRETRGS